MKSMVFKFLNVTLFFLIFVVLYSQDESATVYIYRPSVGSYRSNNLYVFMNETYTGSLKRNSLLKYTTFNEGRLEIEVMTSKSQRSRKALIDLQFNKEYYFVLESSHRKIKFVETDKNGFQKTSNTVKAERNINFIQEKYKEKPVKAPNNISGTLVAAGTGFAITTDGYCVTCHHVIDGAKSIKIEGINGDYTKQYAAKVIKSDSTFDLAILKIDDPDFTAIEQIPYTIDSDTKDVGTEIFTLGYPLTETMGYELKLTDGIISAKSGFMGITALYQVSAPVQPGNSGGPMLDKKGNIVGVINAKHILAENATYAIKSALLVSFIESLHFEIQTDNNENQEELPLIDQVKRVRNFVYIIYKN